MSSLATLAGQWFGSGGSSLSSIPSDWWHVNSELFFGCRPDITESASLQSSLSVSPGFCPNSSLFRVETETWELLSMLFFWKKEEIPAWGLSEVILEWEKLVDEDVEEQVSVSSWRSVAFSSSSLKSGGTSLEHTSSSSSSASFLTCFCFSAAFWKKDWMVPGCVHGDSFFSSAGGWVEDWVVERELWVEATSLERKPAIPPADGASLNLLADRCSRVRGGVLGIWHKAEGLN